jgi:hypothetical protein
MIPVLDVGYRAIGGIVWIGKLSRLLSTVLSDAMVFGGRTLLVASAELTYWRKVPVAVIRTLLIYEVISGMNNWCQEASC